MVDNGATKSACSECCALAPLFILLSNLKEKLEKMVFMLLFSFNITYLFLN